MGGRRGKTRPTAPVDTDTALTALETITRARSGQASRREGLASLQELGDYARQEHCVMAKAIEGFDVLLTPSTPTPAPRDLNTTGNAMFQSPWTACGFPTITLPSGLSVSGLPLGTQLASAPFDEVTLLASAHWCEQVLGFSMTPPVAA